MSGNAKTDIRNTRLLSLGSYEGGMGGRGLEGHVWPYGLLPQYWSAELLVGHLQQWRFA